MLRKMNEGGRDDFLRGCVMVGDAVRQMEEVKERSENKKTKNTHQGVVFNFGDKCRVTMRLDESSIVEFPDGTTVEKRTDGSRIVCLPNGVVIESHANGSKTARNGSNSVVVEESSSGVRTTVETSSSSSNPQDGGADTDSSDEEEEDRLVEELQNDLQLETAINGGTSGDFADDDDDEEDEDDDEDILHDEMLQGRFETMRSDGNGDNTTPMFLVSKAGDIVLDSELDPRGLAPTCVTPRGSIVHHGWLLKEGGNIKRWRKRFFQLTGLGLLEYYDKEPHRGGKYINAVDIYKAQITLGGDAKRPHCFFLHISDDPKTVDAKRSKYKLCAGDNQSRERWIECLREMADAQARKSLSANDVRPAKAHSLVSKVGGKVANLAGKASVTKFARKIVSKKKIRYQEDGFDLDLTYVTPQLIAMGYPAEGAEAVFRNKYEEVYRFLQEKHHDHYKVYNLCSERAYPPTKFHNRVAVFPFDDHNPPPLSLMFDFCRDLDAYLKQDEKNVAAIHCKAGKGRTGVMICSYFLYSRCVSDPFVAMAKFGTMRTTNGKGVTIPSQKRYIGYFSKCIEAGVPPTPKHKVLKTIVVNVVPNCDVNGGCQPYCNVYQDNIFLYTSKPSEGTPPLFKSPPSTTMTINVSVPVKGDIKIEVVHADRVFHQDDKLFSFTFNTAFIEDDNEVVLQRTEIDGAHKSKNIKQFSAAMNTKLFFEDFLTK
eukprot:m.136213 g.136213  ORF g.136213 m.136213 type:complete len:711 (-) comp13134_c0_seq1:2124-4256(-)